MQEGFALIYRLCLRNKDIFAPDFFCTSLNYVAYYYFFIILSLFNNEIRGSILLKLFIVFYKQKVMDIHNYSS